MPYPRTIILFFARYKPLVLKYGLHLCIRITSQLMAIAESMHFDVVLKISTHKRQWLDDSLNYVQTYVCLDIGQFKARLVCILRVFLLEIVTRYWETTPFPLGLRSLMYNLNYFPQMFKIDVKMLKIRIH